MPTTITGTDGVSQVQTGAVESSDLPAGSVIQVVSGSHSTAESTTSGSFVDTSLNASITPYSENSKIAVFCTVPFKTQKIDDNTGGAYFAIERDSSVKVIESNLYVVRTASTGNHILRTDVTMLHLDSPNTTQSVLYTFQHYSNDGQTVTSFELNKTGTITLMEIAG